MEMRILKRQGLSAREIARRTGRSRDTVERHLRCKGDPAYAARPAVAGKLDAYESFVSERVAAAHPERLPGTVLLDQLRARGYTVGITILRAHLACVRIWPPRGRWCRPIRWCGSRRGRVARCRSTGRSWSRFRRRSRWNTSGGSDPTWERPAFGVRRGAWPQPDGVRPVRHRRTAGDVDGVP